MSTSNEQLVTDFCNTLTEANVNKVVSFLANDVFYHNIPWAPVTGHSGVHEVLDPFINAGLLQNMEIRHTASSGDVVTNERMETWVKSDTQVLLPVLGIFTIGNGKITKWSDYFDSGTLAPLIQAMKSSR